MSGDTRADGQRADRDRYHPKDPADYGSAVGYPYVADDGRTYFACVGCSYCCPDTDPSPERGAR